MANAIIYLNLQLKVACLIKNGNAILKYVAFKNRKKLFCRLNYIMGNICSDKLLLSLKFICNMDTCRIKSTHTHGKMGHPLRCHLEHEKFRIFCFYEFPFLRAILRLLYDIKNSNKHKQNAICNLDINVLRSYGDEYKKTGTTFSAHGVEYKNENEIFCKYKKELQV